MSKTNTEKYNAIKDIVDDVGYDLASDTKMSEKQKLSEWVDMLTDALEFLPNHPDYDYARQQILSAIDDPKVEDFDLAKRERMK